MYANKAVPCWQVFDEGYAGRYVSGANPFKKRTLPEALIEQGAVKRADTIGDLARQIDVPADALEETVKRFNGFAAEGLDPDFGRGQSAYNDCLGDPGYKPNAALGPLDRAPYYATRVFPADVGTCGGDSNDLVALASISKDVQELIQRVFKDKVLPSEMAKRQEAASTDGAAT
jgi:3-oxosteroid 1-dehydrogenase